MEEDNKQAVTNLFALVSATLVRLKKEEYSMIALTIHLHHELPISKEPHDRHQKIKQTN